MKNVRYLKNIGLYTPDTICIGRRMLKENVPSGTPPSSCMTYYQPMYNKIIVVHALGGYDIFSFNSEEMYRFHRIKKLDDFTFQMTCYSMNSYISLFREKIKFHGILQFRTRYLGASDEDFGNYRFKFQNLSDAAIFQVYFSEFIS